MRVLLFAAYVFATVSLSALAANSLDGDWKGEISAPAAIKETCGFVKNPFHAVVTGNTFVATGTDGSDNERTFEGEIDDDGRVSVWGDWRAFGYNAEPQTQSTKLTGKFDGSTFTGAIAWTSRGLDYFCGAKIKLQRAS